MRNIIWTITLCFFAAHVLVRAEISQWCMIRNLVLWEVVFEVEISNRNYNFINQSIEGRCFDWWAYERKGQKWENKKREKERERNTRRRDESSNKWIGNALTPCSQRHYQKKLVSYHQLFGEALKQSWGAGEGGWFELHTPRGIGTKLSIDISNIAWISICLMSIAW